MVAIPSELDPSLYPRTDITFDSNGKISQLDTYFPEVTSGQVAIGIDVDAFNLKHPVDGKIIVSHIVEKNFGTAIGVVGDKSFPMLSPELDPEASDLIINTFTSRIHTGAIAVGASSYDMRQAEQDLRNQYN
jgi:hypothetical protein